jgi:hypothetical protein
MKQSRGGDSRRPKKNGGDDDDDDDDGGRKKDTAHHDGTKPGKKKKKKKKKKEKNKRRAAQKTPGKVRASSVSRVPSQRVTVTNDLYKWSVAKSDLTDTATLKLKLIKIPKSPSTKRKIKNASFLKTIKSSKTTAASNPQGVIRLNGAKKNKALSISKTPETVHVGRPQPFDGNSIQHGSSSSVDNVRISGKTGQRITKGSGGKLILSKKNKNRPVTHAGGDGIFSDSLDNSPKPSTSYDEYVSPMSPASPTYDSRPVSPAENYVTDVADHDETALPTMHQEPVMPSPPHTPQQRASPPPVVPKFPYDIIEHRRRYVQKFGVEEIVLKVKFDDDWMGRTLYDMLDDLHRMFDDVLGQVREMYDAGVRARVYINHPDLQYEKPIFVALRPIHLLTPQAILAAIEKILNLNKGLKLDDKLQIHIGIMDIPHGGGFSSITRRLFDDSLIERLKKKTILVIPKDKIHLTCAARAIICGVARLRCDIKKYRLVARKDTCTQYSIAYDLLKEVGLPVDREISIREFVLIENYFDVQVIVYDAPFRSGCIYTGARERLDKIFIYHSDNHFDLITSITGFLKSGYYCTTCRVPYSNKTHHSCNFYCKTCQHLNCIVENEMVCYSCNQLCRSQDCFDRHKNKHSSDIYTLCETNYACKKCKVVTTRCEKNDHICGEYTCSNCHNKVTNPHLCYMRALKPKKNNGKFIFFDFETCAESRQECAQGYKKKSEPNCVTCKTLTTECIKCSMCVNCKDTGCHTLLHIANFAVAQSACNYCVDTPCTPDAKCVHCGWLCDECFAIYKKSPTTFDCNDCFYPGCGKRESIFSGENKAYNFTAYLLCERHYGFTAFAHNGAGFDFLIVLEKIITDFFLPVNTVYSGAKIITLSIPEYKIRLVDSLSFIPMALKQIPAIFDLESSKGDFPHFFNLTENFNYIGPYPDISFYGADSMSTEGRETFIKWHKGMVGEIFDFQKEILTYCRADVCVLREACMKFRDLVMTITATSVEYTSEGLKDYVGGIDPFICSTLAGLCLTVFRTKFLPETYKAVSTTPSDCNLSADTGSSDDHDNNDENKDTIPPPHKKKKHDDDNTQYVFDKSPIGLIPCGGYTRGDTFSRKSIEWLELYSYRNLVRVKHALNGGEFRVPDTNYRVDGYIVETKTILEFLGDYYHGCPKHCENVKTNIEGLTPSQRYAMTVDRIVKLKKMGYTIIEMWECEFASEMKYLTEGEKDHLDSLDLVERLDIRDAFKGGRCNTIVLHSKPTDGSIITYFDVRSMYPNSMKKMPYPMYHPDIITSDFKDDITEYFGIAKVRMLPPKTLYHPVLPYTAAGKLKFPLCMTCAEKENYGICICSDRERSFVDTFISCELVRAIEDGYRVIKIFEIYHWPEHTQYNPVTKDGGLFTPYVDTFLKLKTEASGYPSWCVTENDKQTYIENFYLNEGVRLDPSKIVYNAGLRSIGKAFLNNLWGRLGLRDNLPKTVFCRTPERFFEVINDSTNIIKDFNIINDTTVAVIYEEDNRIKQMNTTTNVALAAFTTCHGRLHLLDYMTQAGENLLYTDTDSLFKISDPKRPDLDPPVGDYLGDLTYELNEGEYITEFCSSGAKSYVYVTNTGKKVCRLKGFTLNHKNSLLINFDVMRDMVLSQKIQGNPDLKTVVTVNDKKIKRKKYQCQLFNCKEIKRYRAVYNKRIILPDLTTVPFGYDYTLKVAEINSRKK